VNRVPTLLETVSNGFPCDPVADHRAKATVLMRKGARLRSHLHSVLAQSLIITIRCYKYVPTEVYGQSAAKPELGKARQ
jgi:hypothetical protein